MSSFTAWVKGEIKQEAYLVPIVLGLISLYALYLCVCIHDSLLRARRQLIRLQKHYHHELNKLPPCVFSNPPLQYWGPIPPLGLGRNDSLAAATAMVWVVLLFTTSFRLLSPFEGTLKSHGSYIVAACFLFGSVLVVVMLLAYRAGIKRPTQVTDTEDTDFEHEGDTP